MEKELSKKLKIQSRIYIKIFKKKHQKWIQNHENRGLEGVWELLGATLGRKISQNLSWPILADFGRARIDQNLARMVQDGAKLEPRWRQDAPSWGQDGQLEAIWGGILTDFGGLGSDI